jgi:hypothetical protein
MNMNDKSNVFDLDDDDSRISPPTSCYTHSFLTEPSADDLEWLLHGLAKYMWAKGSQVASDKLVLLTWHKATCNDCLVNEDLSMDISGVRYDEYVYGPRWMSPNFPVEEVNE